MCTIPPQAVHTGTHRRKIQIRIYAAQCTPPNPQSQDCNLTFSGVTFRLFWNYVSSLKAIIISKLQKKTQTLEKNTELSGIRIVIQEIRQLSSFSSLKFRQKVYSQETHNKR